jgi:hypothetical protein
MARARSGGYERILAVISAARTAIRSSELLTGAGLSVLALGACILLLVGLDNLFRLPMPARIALLVLAAGVTGAVLWLTVVRAASRRMTDDAVAVRLEAAAGDLDNGLINALQLGRDEPEEGLGGEFVRVVVERGATVAGRVPVRQVVDSRRTGRAVGLGIAAVLFVAAYGILLPRHFANAVTRYARPTTFVPPVSATMLAVEPGNTVVLRGRPLTVTVVAEGTLPSSARILVGEGDTYAPSEMPFDGQAFSFTFSSVSEPFSYRVEAADASSPLYHVGVADLPGVRRLSLTYRFPDYLSRPEKVEADATGEIRAPVGTRVTVVAELNQEVGDAALDFEHGTRRTMSPSGPKTVKGEIEVTREDTFAIVLRTRDGLGSDHPVRHRITAIPDEPPEVEITAPGKDQTVTLPARISVTVRARDDYGLSEISLILCRGDGGDALVLATWEPDDEQDKVVSHVIQIPEGKLIAGDVLTCHAEARDRFPGGEHVGVSRPFSIRITSREDRMAEAQNALADLASRIREILEREQGLRRDTAELKNGVATGKVSLSGLGPRASGIAESQSLVGATMIEVAGAVPGNVPALSEVRGILLSLSMNEVMQAVRHLQDSRSRAGPTEVTRDLASALFSEDEVIGRLEELLGQVMSLLKKMEDDPETWIDEKMDEADRDAALREAIAKLKKFIREQEDVLRMTRDLEKKDVDDFTDEDLALLEKLAAQESELSRFLEDLKDDLSKIPDQDFSSSTVLKELIEAYSEVELAADALTRKRVELAVPLEQSGLELAEGLTENIEKWLPDVRDNLKWNMEEMDGEYPEIPMADLPEQLEDLMGELIEEEEELGEDMEDVSSGWGDSIDKGAGWGTSDGPISNMSAQGKTGNTLPNTNEVGGRSGEGRTGRSHGEMVEAEATGKGGRKTPTRLTPDAIEGKAVKDKSTDPLGGATGGGKLAGGAGEGLAGPLPPEVKGDLGRLHGNQVSIRQKAEQLDRALKARHYPSDGLSRSVVLMKEMEEALAKGDLANFHRRHGILVDQMKEGQATVLEHARVMRDRSRAVPKEIMRELESIDLSGLPEGYREYLREYYKILSRGGEK